ncbi:hypothetical protein [Nocardioides hankookensis]|uniref:Uncharacterized protein n=1 Tax=Nocardioides hankookensis TaxID=443157 RepID=A0ABW1LFF6_9ACTN
MEQLNTFNSDDVGDGLTSIACAVGGIILIVIACVIEPRLALALSWLLALGGTCVAVASPARRPVAAGLAFAGAAPPFAIFLWFWVALSGGAFLG